MNPVVSIHCLSWNRPRLLELTLSSLFRNLRKTSIPYEVILLDQGSQAATQRVIGKYSRSIDHVISLSENVGMGEGWNQMADLSIAPYILPLENDWWCASRSPKWLSDAVSILEADGGVGFVKLRRLVDHDDCGFGLEEHSPWTTRPPRLDRYQVCRNEWALNYLRVPSHSTSFTFNPVLMRRELREEFKINFRDESSADAILRTSEDSVDVLWRGQTTWEAAVLLNGPFRHSGFYGRRNRWILTPVYLGAERALTYTS